MGKENKTRVDLMWKALNKTRLEHLILLKDDEFITANSLIEYIRKEYRQSNDNGFEYCNYYLVH